MLGTRLQRASLLHMEQSQEASEREVGQCEESPMPPVRRGVHPRDRERYAPGKGELQPDTSVLERQTTAQSGRSTRDADAASRREGECSIGFHWTLIYLFIHLFNEHHVHGQRLAMIEISGF